MIFNNVLDDWLVLSEHPISESSLPVRIQRTRAGSDVSGSILQRAWFDPVVLWRLRRRSWLLSSHGAISCIFFFVCFHLTLCTLYATFAATADWRSTVHVSLERPMQISPDSRSHIDHGRTRGGKKRPRVVSTRLLTLKLISFHFPAARNRTGWKRHK